MYKSVLIVLLFLFLLTSAIAPVCALIAVGAINASPESGNVPLQVNFTDVSGVSDATSWEWTFGDGNTSFEQNPTYTYNYAGKYNVEVTIGSSNRPGWRTMGGMWIYVTDPASSLEPNYNADPLIGGAPLDVIFTDESEGATSWEWNFGDGVTSNDRNPVHTYTEAGTYNVMLTMEDTEGHNTTFFVTRISVLDSAYKMIPKFKAEPTTGSEPLEVKFTDESEGIVLYRYWDFGDGSVSSKQNPTHKYWEAGTYNVTLTLYSEYPTYFAEVTKSNYIVVNETPTPTPPPGAPTAYVTMTLEQGTTWNDFLKVKYSASVSEGSAKYRWEFESHVSYHDKSDEDSGTYEFAYLGPKNITLTAASDNVNITNSPVTKTITIAEPKAVAKIKVVPVPGTYKIKYLDDSGIPYIKLREWVFGDGNSTKSEVGIDKESGEYTYANPGIYSVNLTINTPGNQTDTVSQLVKISGLTADFTASPTSGRVPLDVKFTDKSTKNSVTGALIDNWEWDFGDGTKSYDQNPIHRYTKTGRYTVTLTVRDKDSSSRVNSDTVTKTNHIVVNEYISSTDDTTTSSDYDSTISSADTTTSPATTTVTKPAATEVAAKPAVTTAVDKPVAPEVSEIPATETAQHQTDSVTETESSDKNTDDERIFGIQGSQPIRSEMQRIYGFFDEFFNLFFGIFGIK